MLIATCAYAQLQLIAIKMPRPRLSVPIPFNVFKLQPSHAVRLTTLMNVSKRLFEMPTKNIARKNASALFLCTFRSPQILATSPAALPG
jgi:hypothetical protein